MRVLIIALCLSLAACNEEEDKGPQPQIIPAPVIKKEYPQPLPNVKIPNPFKRLKHEADEHGKKGERPSR